MPGLVGTPPEKKAEVEAMLQDQVEWDKAHGNHR
jgi:hypothetical protein